MTRWLDNAKCIDMNPLDFDLSDRKVPYQHRQSTAAGLCSGCKVMQACARDALKYVDLVLTVRAGLWVEAMHKPARRESLGRLREIAGY